MSIAAHDTRADARVDLVLVSEMVEPGSRVLDAGCGDGMLLSKPARSIA